MRRRKPINLWRILILLVLIGAGLYVNFFIVPVTNPLFIPTATATRAPETYLADADSLASEGKFSQAIDMYKQAILSDPNNVKTNLSLQNPRSSSRNIKTLKKAPPTRCY